MHSNNSEFYSESAVEWKVEDRNLDHNLKNQNNSSLNLNPINARSSWIGSYALKLIDSCNVFQFFELRNQNQINEVQEMIEIVTSRM